MRASTAAESKSAHTHVIFGAGLVGVYLGAALTESGCQVGFVARERIRQKMRHGIRATDYLGHSYSLRHAICINSPEPADAFPDYLWLTLKCTALTASIDEIRAFVGPDTRIICAQNGLGPETIIQRAFPEHEVIRGVMSANVTEVADGHFHKATEGDIDLPETPTTQALIGAFRSPLLGLGLHRNLDSLIWAKLQMNLNNALNALSDIPLLDQLQQRDYRLVLAAAMDELLHVARAREINLAQLTRVPAHWLPRVMRTPNWLFRRLAKKMLAIDPQARSSMWQDLKSARPSEIAFINGALVREAEKLGIDCPVNRKITELIGQIEQGERQLGIEPEVLPSIIRG